MTAAIVFLPCSLHLHLVPWHSLPIRTTLPTLPTMVQGGNTSQGLRALVSRTQTCAQSLPFTVCAWEKADFPQISMFSFVKWELDYTHPPCVITAGISSDSLCPAPLPCLRHRKCSMLAVITVSYSGEPREICMSWLAENGQSAILFRRPISPEGNAVPAPNWRQFTFLNNWLQ